MRRRLLAAALITLVPWSQAGAQDCNAAADQSTMSQCADQSFRKADASLNATYRQIVARLRDDAATRKSLLTAQRAWLGFRDAECAFSASGVATGSIYPMIVAGCRERLTIDRDRELQRFLHCAEGDLGCPVPNGR